MTFGCQRHAAESASVDVGDSVVLCQAFIQERVIRADQTEHAPILAQYAVEEQFGLLSEGLSQVIVEVPIKGGVGSDGFDIAQSQPLSGEICGEVERASIGEHPACLLLELSRLAQ